MMKRCTMNIVMLVIMGAAILSGWCLEQSHAATRVDGKVNINTAVVNELVLLPMIGPTKAAAIVAYREENGPFESIEDMVNVKGIGRRTLQRLEPYLKLEGDSDLRVVVVVNTGKSNAPKPDQKDTKPSNEKGTERDQ